MKMGELESTNQQSNQLIILAFLFPIFEKISLGGGGGVAGEIDSHCGKVNQETSTTDSIKAQLFQLSIKLNLENFFTRIMSGDL